MGRADKKKSAGPKGQKPLTSFFYTKSKQNGIPSEVQGGSGRTGEADRAPSTRGNGDAVCEVIALENSPVRPQAAEGATPRPSKRLKIDPQAASTGNSETDGGGRDAQLSRGSGSTLQKPESRLQAPNIPDRVPSRHQRFQVIPHGNHHLQALRGNSLRGSALRAFNRASWPRNQPLQGEKALRGW